MKMYLLLVAFVVTSISAMIVVRIGAVAIVNHGGILGGLAAIAIIFAVGWWAAPYLDRRER